MLSLYPLHALNLLRQTPVVWTVRRACYVCGGLSKVSDMIK